MDIISDNDKHIIFSIVLLYANNIKSIISFSMVSKISLNMINQEFKQFKDDYNKNKRKCEAFFDHLSIPIHIWYKLLEKMEIDRHELPKFDYEELGKHDLLNDMNYDKNYWPIKKIQIYHKIDFLEDLSKMRELRSIEMCLKFPHMGYLDDIKLCNKLTHLKLYSCGLNSFPSIICDLKSLKEIIITEFYFTNIPNNINKLTNLETLTLLCGLNCAKFPRAIYDIGNLKRLTINDWNIVTIPNKICKLQKLEYLSMERNKLNTFPLSIVNMPKLKTIIITGNKFTIFPDAFQQMVLTSDTKINMNHNLLTHVTTKYVFTKTQIVNKLCSTLSDSCTFNITSWIIVSVKYDDYDDHVVNYLINPCVFNDKTLRSKINVIYDVYHHPNDMVDDMCEMLDVIHDMVDDLLRTCATAKW